MNRRQFFVAPAALPLALASTATLAARDAAPAAKPEVVLPARGETVTINVDVNMLRADMTEIVSEIQKGLREGIDHQILVSLEEEVSKRDGLLVHPRAKLLPI